MQDRLIVLCLITDQRGGSILQVRNLTLTHRKDLRVILEDFELTLNDGDKAVIIGEEGNGKSTLLKWIYDPEGIVSYMEAEGLRVIGRERLGYLPQELPETEKKKTVYEYFSESEFFFDETPKELAVLAKKFMVEPDFFYRDQKLDSLSGGEKVKTQLMRLLMEEPTVLLLDEPSNDIDIGTLELLENLIKEWKHIVLFISHDEVLIENTANMVIHIEQIMRKTKPRFVVAHMPYQKYREERLHKFEKQKQQAISDRREQKIREEKYRRIMQSVEHAQNTITRQDPAGGRLLKKKMHAVKSMEKRFEREEANQTSMPEQEEAIYFKLGGKESQIPAGKTVIEYGLEELRTPDGERVLASDIFLRVKGAEKICLIGTNGVGKTTLLKKIAQELLGRTDIHAEYMPQNYEELLELAVSPVEFLDTSGEKEEKTRIRTYLGALKFTPDEMEHPIRELSGGQKAKVLLLKMSLSGANVLILDEPTRNFSPLSGPVIRQMIAEFPGAVISISHDRKYIEEVCDTVYRLTLSGLQLEEQEGEKRDQ